MVIAAAIGATSHADHPARVRHLVVNHPQRGGHFVGERACDDHHVGLTGGGAEDYAKTVLVVARSGEVHHFDGAAGEAEGHGPQRGLPGPVGDLVHSCSTKAERTMLAIK